MRIPVSWLREYVDLPASTREIVERLAIASCEVERIVRRGIPEEDGNAGHFRVGRVLEAVKHPNADRLQLCQVDVGEPEPRQIVCGAWNFGAGATVPVALPGAVLPGGQRIEQAKLRGSTSQGMILSERELEIGVDQSGIIVLPKPIDPGTPLADVLPLVDEVIVVETSFNRPDLLSIYGFARELAALFGVDPAPPPGRNPDRPTSPEQVEIRIDDAAGCPRYIGRLFRGARIGPSPYWLKARLIAAGSRPISNAVDVSNYVMLALGNPVHVFDQERLDQGRIVVRRAEEGEELTTLDGQLRRLTAADLVIADPSRAVALAGIMGGGDSEVSDASTELLLEAANFESTGVMRTSEALGLRTDASNRYEKGVDPYLAEQAAVLAAELLVELTGARWVGETDAQGDLPVRPVTRLRPERTEALLGIELSPTEQKRLLERLGFDVDDRGWVVTVPTWRARDVTREADLIEEIARVHGLERIPFTLPQRREMFGRLTTEQRLRRLCEETLVGAGFSEAYTSSLVPAAPGHRALELLNPMSGEHAVLRTTLLDGLVEAAARNRDVGNEGIALFELARVYLPADGVRADGSPASDERWRLGGISEGGFERSKGVLETLYAVLRRELSLERASEPFLHPGKAARTGAGWLGELHPSRLDGRWGVFELDLATLFAGFEPVRLYEQVNPFPPVRQDLALIVADDVPAGDLVAAVREAGGSDVRSVRVFDVYRGEQLGAGRKSVGLAVAFQSAERTLSDEEAAAIRGRIVGLLAQRFGAELRA